MYRSLPVQALKVQVNFALEEQEDDRRRKAFAANVTYLTGPLLAFDFLRDQTQTDIQALFMPRSFSYAIVDEVDLLLLDNATNTFLLSQDDGSFDADMKPRIIRAAKVSNNVLVFAKTSVTTREIILLCYEIKNL